MNEMRRNDVEPENQRLYQNKVSNFKKHVYYEDYFNVNSI
jgi:hypothetical protein